MVKYFVVGLFTFVTVLPGILPLFGIRQESNIEKAVAFSIFSPLSLIVLAWSYVTVLTPE